MDFDEDWLDEYFPEQATTKTEPSPPTQAETTGPTEARERDEEAAAQVAAEPDEDPASAAEFATPDEELDPTAPAPEVLVGDEELAEARELERVLAEQRGVTGQIEGDEESIRRDAGRVDDALEGLPLVAMSVGGRSMRDGGPRITQMSDIITQALREHVRAEAIRSKGVSERAAEIFAEKVSPTSLVMGFLIAGLDVSLAVDETTQLLTDLFRRRSPLLSNVALRVAEMQAHAADLEKRRDRQLERLRSAEDQLLETSHVVEQLVAFLVTDKWDTSVVSPGTLPKDIPFTHKNVTETRDSARRLVQIQHERQKIAEGRPIR